MIPAVAYYRMSSEKQDASIPQQVQAVERYAADNGYRIIRDYRDEGISGDATEKRVQFRQMVADGVRGDFQAVLAWDQDRLGRFDAIEAGRWLSPLRDAGVRIVTVNQGEIDLEDFGGVLIYSVTQGMKHQFLKDLAKNVSRGKWSVAEAGKWVSGAAPLGYRVVDGKLIPDPEEAEIVRRIYSHYDTGYSLREIADRLNRDGIAPTIKRRFPDHPRASDFWKAQVVRPILVNPANIGTYRYNVKQGGKYARVRSGAVTAARRGEAATRDNEHAIVIENAHEAIVPRGLFDRVNRKLTENQRRTSRRDTPHVLTGLCRCGFCGGRMAYNSQRYNGTLYRYLACANNQTRGRSHCDRRSLREETVLPVVVGVLQDRLSHPQSADQLRKELERLCRQKSAPKELGRLKREAIVLEDEIAKARRRVVEVDADMLDLVQEHLRELRRRHEALAARIGELEWRTSAGATQVEAVVEAAMASASEMVDRLGAGDPRRLREALRESVEAVELFVERHANGNRRWRLTRGNIAIRKGAGFMPLVTSDRSCRRRSCGRAAI